MSRAFSVHLNKSLTEPSLKSHCNAPILKLIAKLYKCKVCKCYMRFCWPNRKCIQIVYFFLVAVITNENNDFLLDGKQ